jgi:hypothetical protein
MYGLVLHPFVVNTDIRVELPSVSTCKRIRGTNASYKSCSENLSVSVTGTQRESMQTRRRVGRDPLSDTTSVPSAARPRLCRVPLRARTRTACGISRSGYLSPSRRAASGSHCSTPDGRRLRAFRQQRAVGVNARLYNLTEGHRMAGRPGGPNTR